MRRTPAGPDVMNGLAKIADVAPADRHVQVNCTVENGVRGERSASWIRCQPVSGEVLAQ